MFIMSHSIAGPAGRLDAYAPANAAAGLSTGAVCPDPQSFGPTSWNVTRDFTTKDHSLRERPT